MVGHSVFFKVYTAQDAYWEQIYDSVTHDKYPTEEHSLTMMNCEIHPDLSVTEVINALEPDSSSQRTEIE